jgi:oxygen-dependent protoporphyrinogen oxidase
MSDNILQKLRVKFPNVELHPNTAVASINPAADGKIALRLAQHGSEASVETFDHVVGAVSSPVLASVLSSVEETTELRNLLTSIKFSTVAVVNLAYVGKPEDILPVQGFGFLVPIKDMIGDQTGEKDAMASEPIDALGVIFDSCAAGAQDQDVMADGRQITRLTVMMGGHAFAAKFGDPDAVDPAELLERARRSVRRTLFTSGEPELVASHVSVQKDCIPQYEIGHDLKLRRIREIVDQDRRLQGRLSVCHASYMGVSMNDCVMYGRELAVKLAAAERLLEVDSLTGLRV